MFDNFSNLFGGMFGKVASGMCRLTMNGQIAVKVDNTYKCYNMAKNRLTNVTNFCFNVGDEMFFVIPTNKVAVGDIILVKGKPKCVKSVGKDEITVIDYESDELRQIVPVRHVFMGSTYFYGKIVSMFGNAFSKGKGGLGNVVKMMMMSQMMGGGNSNNNNNLGQLMAMSMFMGDGEKNPFAGIFDGMFNFDDSDLSTDSDSEEDEDEDNSTK